MPPSRATGPVELTTDQAAIQAVAAAMKAEADGKALRRDLSKEFRAAARPVVTDLKAAAQAIPSQGLPQAGGMPLRQTIARNIAPVIRLTGAQTGVAIRAKSTPKMRKFRHAARQMNAAAFRHRVFGRDVWVSQTGKPGWFDNTIPRHREEFRRAVMRAVDDMASRIASRTRS